MSKSSDETLTKYIAAKTIITADLANSLFGGLYGSSEGDLLDTDDVKVIGHVHDGTHVDGHAQKIDLVAHVTGKLENPNLADQAVMKNNVYRSENQTEAIPWYEVSDGKTLYYLNLASVTLDAVATNGNTTDQSITIGSDSESPVGKLDVHHVGEAIDDSDMDQFAINIVNGRELLDFGGVQEYSDGASGYTLITTNSDHGLITGDCVVINNTTNYDGVHNVTKIGDKSFKIYATYIAETVAGDEQFRQLISETGIGFRVSTDTSAVSPGAAITHKRYVSGTTHTDDSVGSLNFKTKPSSSAKDLDTRMTIDKDGLVGIGTISPQYRLHVQNLSNHAKLALTRYQSGSITTGHFTGSILFGGTEDGATFDYGAAIGSSAEGTWTIGSDIPANITLWTAADGSSTLSERMRIDNSGKVGIGTVGGTHQLEINSANGANLRLTYNDSDGINVGSFADFTLSSGGDLTINASGDTTLNDNVTVSGNLTVNGTTTTVNSTTLTVDDPLIYLGGDTAPASDDNFDRGIAFRWYDSATSSAKIGFMGWDDSKQAIIFGKAITITAEVVTTPVNTGAAKVDLQGAELILDADGNTSITADTDNQIDIKIAGADDFQFTANKFLVQTGSSIDLNGTELVLDADGNTSITADTNDQIDIKVGATDRFSITTSAFRSLNTGGPYLISAAPNAGAPAYSFDGDTNTGMYRSAADTIDFSTGGEHRVKIKHEALGGSNQAQVGINTPTPATGAQLSCAASAADSAASITSYSTTDTHGGVLKLRHSDTNTIAASGTVMASDATFGKIEFHGFDSNAFGEAASIRGLANQTTSWRTGNHGGELSFWTTENSSATPTERMTIDSSGKVGIGTSDPASMFAIAKAGVPAFTVTSYNDGAGGPEIRLRHSRGATVGAEAIVADNDYLGKIIFKGNDGDSYPEGATIAARVMGTPGDGDMPAELVFSTTADGAGAAAERMTIDYYGVGIGAAPNDTQVLNVSGAPTVTGSTDSFAARFYNSNNDQYAVGISIRAGGTGSSGQGDIRYVRFEHPDSATRGGIQCGASVANPEFFNGSDLRIKKDVSPTKINGIEIINKLDLIEFRWDPDFCSSQKLNRIGFTAQSCEEAYPEMVSEHSHEKFDFDVKNISKAELIPILVKAVQELSAEVNELKTKLAEYSNSNGN